MQIFLQQKPAMIIIALLLFLYSCKAEDYEPTQTILSTSQFYFIPDNEYFQFRVTSAELGYFSQQASISKIIVNLNFRINNKQLSNIAFNIIILPPLASQSQNYGFYKCYMRAAFQGISNKNCKILSETTNGNCAKCVSNASNKTYPYACQGCNQSFEVSILQNLNQQARESDNGIDENLLIIIDNTNVIAETKGYLEMYLDYTVQLVLNESDATIVLFFLVMLIVIIVIALISAIYLTYKIKKINVIIANHIKVQ